MSAEQKFFERALVGAYLAHTRQQRVSADTICAQDPGLDMTRVALLLDTPKFRESLEQRGIPAEAVDGQLSAEQLFAIQVMVDPATTLSPWAKLRRLGITFTQWNGWLAQPAFARAYSDVVEKITAESVPNALTRLNQLADAGDMKAIEMLLKLTGRLGSDQGSVTDFKRLMAVVLEAVQRNVSSDVEYAAVVKDLFREVEKEGVAVPELQQ
jgi:hypothetical protein